MNASWDIANGWMDLEPLYCSLPVDRRGKGNALVDCGTDLADQESVHLEHWELVKRIVMRWTVDGTAWAGRMKTWPSKDERVSPVVLFSRLTFA
jgi:hypothetical protein